MLTAQANRALSDEQGSAFKFIHSPRTVFPTEKMVRNCSRPEIRFDRPNECRRGFRLRNQLLAPGLPSATQGSAAALGRHPAAKSVPASMLEIRFVSECFLHGGIVSVGDFFGKQFTPVQETAVQPLRIVLV